MPCRAPACSNLPSTRPTCPPPPPAEDVPLWYSDGGAPARELDAAVEGLFNDLLEECHGVKGVYERAGGDTSLGAGRGRRGWGLVARIGGL